MIELTAVKYRSVYHDVSKAWNHMRKTLLFGQQVSVDGWDVWSHGAGRPFFSLGSSYNTNEQSCSYSNHLLRSLDRLPLLAFSLAFCPPGSPVKSPEGLY